MADQTTDASQFLTVRSCAKRNGWTESQVRHWISRGLIPYRKLGSRLYLVQAEIDQFFTNLPGVSVREAAENYRKRYGGD